MKTTTSAFDADDVLGADTAMTREPAIAEFDIDAAMADLEEPGDKKQLRLLSFRDKLLSLRERNKCGQYSEDDSTCPVGGEASHAIAKGSDRAEKLQRLAERAKLPGKKGSGAAEKLANFLEHHATDAEKAQYGGTAPSAAPAPPAPAPTSVITDELWDATYKHGGIVVYHGTSDDAIAGIKTHGLVPGGSGTHQGADKIVPGIGQHTVGKRKASVFMAHEETLAHDYARMAEKANPGSKAVILAIRVPKEHVGKLVDDELTDWDPEMQESNPAVRFKGTIPPEWIRVVTGPPKKGTIRRAAETVSLADDGTVTVYAVILVEDLAVAAGDAFLDAALEDTADLRLTFREQLFALGRERNKCGQYSDTDETCPSGGNESDDDMTSTLAKGYDDATTGFKTALATVQTAHDALERAAKAAGINPWDTRAVRALPEHKAWKTAERTFKAADKTRAKDIADSETRAREQLTVEDPQRVTIEKSHLKRPETEGVIRAALDVFERANGAGPITIRAMHPTYREGASAGYGAGWHKGGGGELVVNEGVAAVDIPRMIWHEMGHAIEDNVLPEIKPEAKRLRDSGVKLVSPYASKPAEGLASEDVTEVVSTGVEHYLAEPGMFAKTAPEHFAFIRKIMTGGYSKKTKKLSAFRDKLLSLARERNRCGQYADDDSTCPVPGGQSGGARGGVRSTTRADLRLATGKDKARLRELKVPPGWTHVRVSTDPKADLQAMGVDSKGRTVRLYSSEFRAQQDASKFDRLEAFQKAMPKLQRRVEADLQSDDPATREAALLVRLIDTTGFRPGSDVDTKAETKATGATTLEARHVRINGDTIEFKFTGKKGVPIEKTITDPTLAKALKPRLAKGGRLFDTDAAQLREYVKKAAGAAFKVKDLRTHRGTATALREIKKLKPPKTEKEFKQAQKAIATIVAKTLGNTWQVALASYIHPATWDRLRHG